MANIILQEEDHLPEETHNHAVNIQDHQPSQLGQCTTIILHKDRK